MNIDKNIIKERLHEILKFYGASPGSKNKNWNCISFRHKSIKSAENDLSVTRDKGELICCCHCGLEGDALNVIEIMEGITDFNEQLQRACQILGIQPDDGEHYPIKEKIKKAETPKEDAPEVDNSLLIGEWHKNVNQTDYFKRRGLTDKIINKYRLGYNPNGGKPGKQYKYLLPVTKEYIIYRNSTNEGAKTMNCSGCKTRVLKMNNKAGKPHYRGYFFCTTFLSTV